MTANEKVKSLSCVPRFVIPWTAAHQGPPSMEFSRQEYWSGLPIPSPGDLPNPGIEPRQRGTKKRNVFNPSRFILSSCSFLSIKAPHSRKGGTLCMHKDFILSLTHFRIPFSWGGEIEAMALVSRPTPQSSIVELMTAGKSTCHIQIGLHQDWKTQCFLQPDFSLDLVINSR